MNGAELDPFEGRPLYEPRRPEEEFDIDYDYHPFQEIVPDTRVGFDLDGHFHSIEHFTAEAINNIITPHRWADYLQDALTTYISTFDYTVGASERDDIVQDIVAERMEAVDTVEEALQLEEALEIWRRKYRYGIRP